jgi:hypothetical protein
MTSLFIAPLEYATGFILHYLRNKNDFIAKKVYELVGQSVGINDNTEFNGGSFNINPAMVLEAFKTSFESRL